MREKTKLITAPTVEPISLEDAKEHVRNESDFTLHDAQLLPRLITAAREYCEDVCSRRFVTQTWETYPSGFCGSLAIPFGSLQSVSVFEWTDTAGTAHTWSISGTNLLEGSTVRAHIDTVGEPGRIVLAYNNSWPNETLRTVNPIRIRFTCGYGDSAASVPNAIKQAMLLLIDHWYRNTSDVVSSDDRRAVSVKQARAVDDLLANYRLHY